MAPIPIRLPDEALSLISAAERRYRHLNEEEIHNLRNCAGPLAAQQTLADGLRENTGLLMRQIEELEMMIDDLAREKNRSELRRIVDDFKAKLDSLRKDSRAALLASKRTIDSQSNSNRDELLLAFTSSQEKDSVLDEKSRDDTLMKANSDVTDALRRTIVLMQTELERSVLSTQLLDSSTASLRSTSWQHDTFSSVMSTSKQLITALEKSDWLDRMLILSAFAFFLLVVLFIIKQRIVDKSLRIAFWWTRFLPNFIDDAALLKDAEKGMASVLSDPPSQTASVVSSLVIPVSSALSSAFSMLHPLMPTLTDDAFGVTLSPPESTSLAPTSTIPTATGPLNHVEL